MSTTTADTRAPVIDRLVAARRAASTLSTSTTAQKNRALEAVAAAVLMVRVEPSSMAKTRELFRPDWRAAGVVVPCVKQVEPETVMVPWIGNAMSMGAVEARRLC